jgi:hypothetical protein
MCEISERKAVLVYQAGIANVFEVQCFNLSDFGRDAVRLVQGDFRTCETFARGLKHAGYQVFSFHCNQAGDITFSHWDDNLTNAPFHSEFRPVFSKNTAIHTDVSEYYNL